MTRENAIDILRCRKDGDAIEVLEMAIEALEKEPNIAKDGTLTVSVEDGNKVSRVLVCGDNHFGGLYYPEGGGE